MFSMSCAQRLRAFPVMGEVRLHAEVRTAVTADFYRDTPAWSPPT